MKEHILNIIKVIGTSLDKFEINYIVAAKEQGVWKVKQWSGYSIE